MLFLTKFFTHPLSLRISHIPLLFKEGLGVVIAKHDREQNEAPPALGVVGEKGLGSGVCCAEAVAVEVVVRFHAGEVLAELRHVHRVTRSEVSLCGAT